MTEVCASRKISEENNESKRTEARIFMVVKLIFAVQLSGIIPTFNL